jgi:sortase A
MTFVIRTQLPGPARLRRLLLWSRNLLWIGGILALAYVVLTVLEARLYQASAERSLEGQLRAGKENTSPLRSTSPVVKAGDTLGRVDVPRLGLSVAVMEGTKPQMLRLGVGHIEGTALPGEAGNIGIAGHRDTFFRQLRDVRRDDEIRLQTPTELLRYQVDWVKVVAPDDVSVLTPSSKSMLTLVTCYPFQFLGSAPQRFVVRAHQYSPLGAVKDRSRLAPAASISVQLSESIF